MRNRNEIGMIAKELDRNTTTFDRMKLRKTTLHKLAIALFVYVSVMTLMGLFL